MEVSTEIRRLLLEMGQHCPTERPEGLDVDGYPLAFPPLAPGSDYSPVDDDGGLNEPAASLHTLGEGRIEGELPVAIVEQVRVEMAKQQGDAGMRLSPPVRTQPRLADASGDLLELLYYEFDRPPSLPDRKSRPGGEVLDAGRTMCRQVAPGEFGQTLVRTELSLSGDPLID